MITEDEEDQITKDERSRTLSTWKKKKLEDSTNLWRSLQNIQKKVKTTKSINEKKLKAW